MNGLKLLLKTALLLLLLSMSTSAAARGWGIGPDHLVQPLVGETRGDVAFVPFDLGTGPCAAFPPIPDPFPEGPLANVQTVTIQKGVLKRLGSVVIETAHCALGPFALDGTFVMYARGGTLTGTYESETIDLVFASPPTSPLPPPGSLIVQEGVYVIDGGTGRYEGVSGRLPFQVFITAGEYEFAEEAHWTIRSSVSGHIKFSD